MKKAKSVYFPYSGANLLDMALLNKGNAFSMEERKEFNLEGLLPQRIETIEEQLKRAYQGMQDKVSDLEKHIYLRSIQDTNETLFYRLVVEHFEEVLPIIYTPTVGLACEKFSQVYRERRGLFLSYPNRATLVDQIWNVSRKQIKVIVITDGERILGLGDLGTGGMGIPIGKLSLYTGGGGISPAYTLPIYVDVGTNNEKLLNDEMYIGWRHKRIDDQDYYAFLEQIMLTLEQRWPGVLIQFEDFGQSHAFPLLETYRKNFCCFNDDIQGTAAVTLATLLSACLKTGKDLKKETIVMAGAGSAACGIADLIIQYKIREGLKEQEALNSVYIHNSQGLICEESAKIHSYQKKYTKTKAIYQAWQAQKIVPTLEETLENTKAGILIGVSGQSDLFDASLVKKMAKNCERPIIFPLSNPTSKAEAKPKNLLEWTDGKAVIAVGSPFASYVYQGQEHHFAQCNNCYIFPGIGLGVATARPKHISDAMILVAAETLAHYTKRHNLSSLLPRLKEVRNISKEIAFQVVKQGIAEGLVLEMKEEEIIQKIDHNFWIPEYREYKRTAF